MSINEKINEAIVLYKRFKFSVKFMIFLPNTKLGLAFDFLLLFSFLLHILIISLSCLRFRENESVFRNHFREQINLYGTQVTILV